MWLNILIYVLLAIYVIICVLMMLVILMQRSKQDGLGAAFGGGMMDSAFGPSTSVVLVKSTVTLSVIYFVITLTLAWLYAFTTPSSVIAREVDSGTTLQQQETEVVDSIAKEQAGETPGSDIGLPPSPTPEKEAVSGAGTVTEGEQLGQDVTPPAPSQEAQPGDAPASEATSGDEQPTKE